jgi:hypothetical protein
MTTIQPGAYQVNGQYVRVDVTPSGWTVLSRYWEDGVGETRRSGMRVLQGEERALWLKALGMDEDTP